MNISKFLHFKRIWDAIPLSCFDESICQVSMNCTHFADPRDPSHFCGNSRDLADTLQFEKASFIGNFCRGKKCEKLTEGFKESGNMPLLLLFMLLTRAFNGKDRHTLMDYFRGITTTPEAIEVIEQSQMFVDAPRLLHVMIAIRSITSGQQLAYNPLTQRIQITGGDEVSSLTSLGSSTDRVDCCCAPQGKGVQRSGVPGIKNKCRCGKYPGVYDPESDLINHKAQKDARYFNPMGFKPYYNPMGYQTRYNANDYAFNNLCRGSSSPLPFTKPPRPPNPEDEFVSYLLNQLYKNRKLGKQMKRFSKKWLLDFNDVFFSAAPARNWAADIYNLYSDVVGKNPAGASSDGATRFNLEQYLYYVLPKLGSEKSFLKPSVSLMSTENTSEIQEGQSWKMLKRDSIKKQTSKFRRSSQKNDSDGTDGNIRDRTQKKPSIFDYEPKIYHDGNHWRLLYHEPFQRDKPWTYKRRYELGSWVPEDALKSSASMATRSKHSMGKSHIKLGTLGQSHSKFSLLSRRRLSSRQESVSDILRSWDPKGRTNREMRSHGRERRNSRRLSKIV